MSSVIFIVTLFSHWAHVGASVSPEMVCSVQRSVIRQPTWSESEYQRIAAALKETPRPRTVAAMAVLESDSRPGVDVEEKTGIFDVGLLGVRCALYPGSSALARGYGHRSAGDSKPNDLPAGRCQNGSARGLD